MKLFYRQPAQNWHEGFPLGNGRLGVVWYREGEKEILQINEDTLWSGYPAETQKGFRPEDLAEVKTLAKERRYLSAMRLLEKRMQDTEDVQIYEPFGSVAVEFMGEDSAEDYSRQLDLERAVAQEEYAKNRKRYRHTCFVSAPAQGICYRIWAEEPFTVRFYAQGGFLTKKEYGQDGFVLYGQCPGRNHFTVSNPPKDTEIPFFGDPREQGMLYKGIGKIRAAGGNVEACRDGVWCRDVTEVTLFLAVRSSFNGYDRHPCLEGADPDRRLSEDISAADKDFEKLLEEHAADYRRYFTRMGFSLGESGGEETDLRERLLRFEKEPSDLGLVTLLFDYGRYLLISCSRPGTQAANLQGIWNPYLIPPWFSDYTVNINTQMNYWLVGPCNLAELAEPLVRMNRELLDNGRQTARLFFGCSGCAAFHNVDLWRKTSPADGRAVWAFWPFGAAWMCRNLYDTYLFTQDRVYLEEILPILRENVIFCQQILEKTKKGYAVCPATSPENEFLWEGERVSVAYYTENTLAVIRNLFRDYREAAEILGQKDEIWRETGRLLEGMVPTAVGSDGRITEWNEEFTEADREHRHLSHLYELHPGRGITRKDEGLYRAAAKSLEQRGDQGTGWSLAWKILMWARLEDGAHAGRMVKKLFHLVDAAEQTHIQGGGLYANLLCAHPPFQIDGNFGYTAGIMEMLLQSHAGELTLLPAVPGDWKTGRVWGAMARGCICVDMEWDENTLRFTLLGKKDTSVRLRIGKREARTVELQANVPYRGTVAL